MRSKIVLLGIFFFVLYVSCGESPEEGTVENYSKAEGVLVENENLEDRIQAIPLLKTHLSKIRQSLKLEVPVLLLEESNLSSAQHKAQNIALESIEFTKNCRDVGTGESYHNEIMQVKKLSNSEMRALKLKTPSKSCFQVELYNYYFNLTKVAYIDLEAESVIEIRHYGAKTPEVRHELRELAIEIALANKEVQSALGIKRASERNSFQTVINETKCERTRHLGLAPTFIQRGRALWVLVDLTDYKVIGYQWTAIGNNERPIRVTQRSLQNDVVSATYCDKINSLERADWKLDYRLTSSDGMEILNVYFKNKKVLNSAKIVDWHVSYAFKRGFGYSDAIGCPMFSAAAVVAFDGPKQKVIKREDNLDGFALIQDFRSPVWPVACNYRYENRFEFYEDGSFQINGLSHGLGCGDDGIYRPVFRIDLAVKEDMQIAQWENNAWKKWETEQWHLQSPLLSQKDSDFSPDGYLFKITSKDGKGYFMQPNRGRFKDNSRGDNAFTYVTVKHVGKGEGEENMSTIGACCNEDYQQGPEKFMDPSEPLSGRNFIIWYVPQMKIDGRAGNEHCWVKVGVKDGHTQFTSYPGTVGPRFVPIISSDKLN